MAGSEVIAETWSVCPVCLKRIPAQRVRNGDKVFLRKSCSEHGSFECIIWRGFSGINKWINGSEAIFTFEPLCPDNCGLCPDHLQKTCCVILNVTGRCNLKCRYCFANPNDSAEEPPLESIRESLLKLTEKGKSLVQLSGGEPTTRKDLPEIISTAKDAGAKYVQLNSNGIRLGEDKQYVRDLAGAGLSFVFMQFDGTDDAIYEALRGKALLEIKQKAIENCAEYNLGVTLVPTLVRDINTSNIGQILRFAIAGVPAVRGVHFQPVSFFGRMPYKPGDNERITLDELLFEIEKQTEGTIKSSYLLPSGCDHPLCGFHGSFFIDHGNIISLLNSENRKSACSFNTVAAERNREFIAGRWLRPHGKEELCCGDIHDMDYFLNHLATNSFTVTAMAFQDAGNIDFSRLRRCSLHVYDNGRFVPFCAYYLSRWES